MAPPTLTTAEHELLAHVLKTYPIDIDIKRLADEFSIKPGAASMRWTRFKEKISRANSDADDNNAPKTPASGKKRKAATPATGTGKTKGKKAAKNEDSDDEDGADAGATMDEEVDGSPTPAAKKVKTEDEDE